MKGFKRENLLFSLCGLNCGLCPMNLNQYCPGCGGGEGNQSCSIAKCSLQHGAVEYCFQCGEYPCPKYDGIEEFDSFITHRHQKRDMLKFKEIGAILYLTEQQKKRELLVRLLEGYNDGRKKTLFCLAVNLLELEDLESIVLELDQSARNLPVKERAACAAALLQKAAQKRNVELRSRKKK